VLSVILPVVLYCCETWSVAGCGYLKQGVKVMRIFGPKREAATGGWRRLHNEELRNFFSSPNIIKEM
jgi:hypothetical protein